MNVEKSVVEAQTFQGGVVDTSSLIYLEKIGMLEKAAASFSFLAVPQVRHEYGKALPETIWRIDGGVGGADEAVLRAAGRHERAVISDDRALLLRAGRQGRPYFNTLMVLIAMYAQGLITLSTYRSAQQELKNTARYNEVVYSFAEKVLAGLAREEQ